MAVLTPKSGIDLIFTSQPNLVTESVVHFSLHRNFHHQIIYAKFNVKIFSSTFLGTGKLAFSKSKHRKYQKSDRLISMDNAF